MAVVLYFDRQMKLYRNFEIAEKIKKGQHSLNSSTDFILQLSNQRRIHLPNVGKQYRNVSTD